MGKIKMEKEFGVVELFAGAGGLALGLEKAGLNTTLLIEKDSDCVRTLLQNRPKWKALQRDIRHFNFSGIKADVVTGGFPCQAFSYAGKKLGFEDTRGTLFFEFARAVKEIQPKIFVAENVSGLVSHDKGRTLETMLRILKEDLDTYDVQYKVLNAIAYSVPQKRQRIFIVGTKKGINFKFPEKHEKTVVLKEALKNVPKSQGTQYSPSRKKILQLVPPGGSWVNLPVELQKEYLGKSFHSGGGKRGMARRLSWDEPSLTLTTSPSQKQTDRCHPDETRPFTIREYARIQTFPDEWQFFGSVASQYKQIGNAVPVDLGYAMGKEIVKALQITHSKILKTTQQVC